MKTSYHPRNKGNVLRRRILAVLAIFIAGAALFSAFDKQILDGAAHIWRGENAFVGGVKNTLAVLRSKSALGEENRILRERISSLETELSTHRALAQREADLLGLLGRSPDASGIIAGVIMRPPATPYDILVIDAGENDGVETYDEVAMLEGPVLGNVVEVSSNSSKVRLFTTSALETNAVLERHSVPVVLIGSGGGNFRINMARDAQVEIGDRVLASNAGGRLIGVVKDVNQKPTDPFKEVLVASPASLFNLSLVRVLP